MGKAKVILNNRTELNDRFDMELKVYGVRKTSKYPDGVKASFVLIDKIENVPRLLIDNHAPFGFHVHPELPHNKGLRLIITQVKYEDAIEEFFRLAMEIINGS